MKRYTFVLALALTACASVPNATPTQLYQAELVFDGAVKTFNELKGLCASKALPSSCRGYVVTGQGVIRQAYAADVAARQFIKNNPTLDATNVIQAFTGLVSTFQSNITALSATK